MQYMGGKTKLLGLIDSVSSLVKFDSVLDGMCGSCAVAYFFKKKGKTVYANDFQPFPYMIAKAVVENDREKVESIPVPDKSDVEREVDFVKKYMLSRCYFYNGDDYIKSNLFKDELYFLGQGLAIAKMLPEYKRELFMTAIFRAMGVYHGVELEATIRTRLKNYLTNKSYWHKPITANLSLAVRYLSVYNNMLIDSGNKCKAYMMNFFDVVEQVKADMVYLDPPYGIDQAREYIIEYDYCNVISSRLLGFNWVVPDYNPWRKFKQTFKHMVNVALENYDIVLLSYADSPNCDLSVNEVLKYFNGKRENVKLFTKEYRYSIKPGYTEKGGNKVKEVLVLACDDDRLNTLDRFLGGGSCG